MQRPQSINLFDWFYLSSLFLSALGTYAGWPMITAEMEAQSAETGFAISPALMIGLIAIGFAISLLLWFLVSRQRSGIAKWILILFFLLGLTGLPAYFDGTLLMSEMYGLASIIAQAVAVGMLFRPDALAWVRGEDPAPAPSDGE